MRNLTREAFILGIASAFGTEARFTSASAAASAYRPIVGGVGYVPGDIEGRLTCNTGVIDLGGALSIVDAALPSGSASALAALRSATDAPPRHVINTHYHLDHTYGNAFWHQHGATPLAVTGVPAEFVRAEPEVVQRGHGLWNTMERTLPELRSSHPETPRGVPSGTSLSGSRRSLELLHPGVGHTHSDGVVWLAAERVLFTGDLVVNGPYNAVADSTISAWIETLDRLRALRPAFVIPGHGFAGGPELIERQQDYFRAVTAGVVDALRGGRDVAAGIPEIRRRILADPRIASFVNRHHARYSGFFHFHDLVAKIYHERTGEQLARSLDLSPPAVCCGDIALASQRANA